MNVLNCTVSRTSSLTNILKHLKTHQCLLRNTFGNLFMISKFARNYSLIVNGQVCSFNKKCIVKLRHNFSDNKGSLIPKTSKDNTEVSTSIKETVKETTKTTFNSLVIIAGIGVTGLLFYAVFRELFSGKSPNSVYSEAFKKCSQDLRVQDALGEPIKGHGETTRRGRRRHVNHISYMKDNVEHMRMQFYLKGFRKNGTVHLEVIEGANGKYEYRYLFVQMDDWPNKVIVLEDNRHDRTALSANIPTPLDIDSTDGRNFA